MIRRACAVGTGVALLAGVCMSPLVHAHVSRSHAADGGSRIHTHLDGHGSSHRHATPGGLAVQTAADADADLVATVQLFVAVHTDATAPVGLTPSPATLTALRVSMTRPLPDIVRSHGPPRVRPLASRAPPVSLLS